MDSEPELVVVSVTAGDAPPIGLVEMEVLGELLPGGLAGEAAVALLLRTAFLAELEDRQFLVGEILRTSGDAEVGDGFQGGVQEKVQHGLFATVSDYGIQIVAWSDSVEQDGSLF